jgi:hypothetical protein
MKVKYINIPPKGIYSDGRSDSIEIRTEDNKRVFDREAHPLATDCPEDATLERSMLSCGDILEAIRIAYWAGKNGEELTIEEYEENEEDNEDSEKGKA